ncbi:MAG: NADH/ubiquinone/plastoquinone (complex I), partial [Acidimicrobiaceae bacterium]|nr:NADH/ubiquinone/plastoquinone (complex I) [Acidimicrobiaceae bacterium]
MLISSVFEIALLFLVAAIATDLLFGPSRRYLRGLPYVFGAVGSALNLAVGISVLMSGPLIINFGSLFGIGTTALVIDNLTALFLIWLLGLAFLVSIFSVFWINKASSPRRRGLATGYILLLGSVVVILSARDAFTFIFAWESLTLAFFILTSATRQSKIQAQESWLTLVIQKIGGASILVGFLLLAGKSGTLLFSDWRILQTGSVHDIAYGLIVLGFGAKLGIVPLQGWMPDGYSIASGPTRAAMAGIAANVAVYGLLRFFAILGRPPVWLVVGVLLLGGATAILGIAFAGVERRLSKLIAYSSVENAGIIFTAFGVALAGAATNDKMLIALGLLAATLHSIAHSIAKSTLFISLVNIESEANSDDIEHMSGIGKTLPYSGISFTIGALTLAGLPPTIGFVSEWLVLESLMQEFRISSLAIRLALLAAGALVALTSGLAALAFLRVIGLVLLGKPKADTKGPGERLIPKAVMLIMAGSCFAISIVTPWEIRFAASSLSPIIPKLLVDGALHSPWVIQPVFSNFSILSPSWLFIAMPSLFAGVLFLTLLASKGRYFKARRVPPWHSATIWVERNASYTAFGFTNL